ncbi:hypothetical protein AB0M28_28300 [Streptomyces sp. NPDC051940]|uniref:hypothetical protein n=1 Tax=Streptomyces sp. NPDC051940 TaxID=3155675 RepID=UPI00341B5FF9
MRAFLDYAAGVLALVLLTASVCWGVLAGLLPATGLRLLAQRLHGACGAAALACAAAHGAVKTAAGRLDLGGTGHAVLLGLGFAAVALLGVAAVTGLLRGALAGRGRVSLAWRALHAAAYPAWCLALVHGLKAGRPPAGWVTGAYAACLGLVAVGVAMRLAARGRAVRRAGRHGGAVAVAGPPGPRPAAAALPAPGIRLLGAGDAVRARLPGAGDAVRTRLPEAGDAVRPEPPP